MLLVIRKNLFLHTIDEKLYIFFIKKCIEASYLNNYENINKQ